VVDKAGVPAETEQFMRLATNEKIAMLKEAHKFPEELNIEIERPDFTKIAEELVQETKKPKLKGLGQHSRLTIDDQMKIDKMDPPKVILDNGDIVDSVNNIIDAVKNLGNKHKKYNDAVQKKAELRDMFLKTAGLNVGDELALTKYIFEKEREKSASIKDVLTGKRYGEASRLKEVAQEIADLSDYNANKVIEPERLGDKIRHYYHQNHPQFTEDQINDHVNKMVDRYKGVKVIDAVKDMEDNADPIILREGMKTIGAWGAIGGASAVGAKKGYDALKARQKQHQDAFNQGQTKSMGFDSLKTNQNALQGAHETAGNMYQQHRY
jgi:hypothetical protein